MKTKRVERKIARLEKFKAAASAKYDGKEQGFTFHGGFDSGYLAGQLHELYNFMDMVDDEKAQTPLDRYQALLRKTLEEVKDIYDSALVSDDPASSECAMMRDKMLGLRRLLKYQINH